MVTLLPAAATTPASGDWLITSPEGTLELVVFLAVDLKPAPSRVDSASLCARPTTSGRADSVGAGAPVETVIVTVLPAAVTTPAAGDWLMTSPAGTLELVVFLPST